jgi:stress-induced morphogen
MSTRKRKTADDKYVREIHDKLMQEYVASHPKAQVTVYRFNSVSIRVRIIDPDFEGLTRTERDTLIWDILDTLSEDTRAEISLLLLVTPRESKTSYMNLEFNEPRQSRL